jgi:hypothetical protein
MLGANLSDILSNFRVSSDIPGVMVPDALTAKTRIPSACVGGRGITIVYSGGGDFHKTEGVMFRSLRGGGVEVGICLEGAWRMSNNCVAMRMSVRVLLGGKTRSSGRGQGGLEMCLK